MYGLVVMLSIPKGTTSKNIDKIGCLSSRRMVNFVRVAEVDASNPPDFIELALAHSIRWADLS